MMEPLGTVQHCIDTADGPHDVYVCTLITDDDSTTRANVKHSHADIIENEFPGSKDADGNIPSRQKRAKGWPIDPNNIKKLLPDTGKPPIRVPEVKRFLADPQHRIRSVGKAFYDCKVRSKAKTKTDLGLTTEECANARRNFGYYTKKNQN